MAIFDDLGSALDNLVFGTSGAGRRLIIITAGRGKVVSKLLKNHLQDVGNVEGVTPLLSTLSSTCSSLQSAINPSITCSVPSVSGNDQEKSLQYLNGIDAIINLTAINADSVDGADVEDVCDGLAACADNIEVAAANFMGYA